MTTEQLADVIEKHGRWRRGEAAGVRANLRVRTWAARTCAARTCATRTCACGHWASDHVIPADDEQPASNGPCGQDGCPCSAMRRNDEPHFADPNDRLDQGQTEAQWEWAHGPGIR